MWVAQVAFLDLRKADVPAGAGLVSTGPKSCMSGQLQLIQGQLGMSSQVDSSIRLIAELKLLFARLSERGEQTSEATTWVLQVVFRLPAQLAEQCMLYNTEEGSYQPLEPPQTLIPEQLAMLLPAAVAMQARTFPDL